MLKGVDAKADLYPEFYAVRAAVPSVRIYVQPERAWQYQSPTVDTYNWAYFDTVFYQAYLAGLHVLPTIMTDTSPSTDKPNTPEKIDRVARFCYYFANRYGFEHYELWNEPNLHPFALNYDSTKPIPAGASNNFGIPPQNGISVQQMANLLAAVKPALFYGRSGSKLILAGLTPNGSNKTAPSYLQGLYAIPGAKANFDAVAHHPYGSDANASINLASEMRAIMVSNGDSAKQIWFTEFGWGTSQAGLPTSSRVKSESAQATETRAMLDYFYANRGAWNIGGAYVFNWKDEGGDLKWQNYCGLTRTNGTHKALFNTVQAAPSGP